MIKNFTKFIEEMSSPTFAHTQDFNLRLNKYLCSTIFDVSVIVRYCFSNQDHVDGDNIFY